ncbi:phage tail protein, partial [Faecalicatena fissicatena]|nr:phage tail protein [Faecalicatena fissicatena]
AEVSVKRTGGGVNGVVEVEAKMTICSDLKVTDPS